MIDLVSNYKKLCNRSLKEAACHNPYDRIFSCVILPVCLPASLKTSQKLYARGACSMVFKEENNKVQPILCPSSNTTTHDLGMSFDTNSAIFGSNR